MYAMDNEKEIALFYHIIENFDIISSIHPSPTVSYSS